jgi:dolichol-phosphate mannosyltransferase
MIKFAWTGVTSFSLVPLRLAIVLGMITSVTAFCGLAYAIWGKLFDQAVPGWASLIGIESLLFGILFMMLGILGEYIGRILEEVRGRPRFIIDERMGFTLPDKNTADITASRPAETAIVQSLP